MIIKGKQSLGGTLSGKGTVSGSVTQKESIHGTLGISTSGVTEQYKGDYEVTPRLSAQVLETRKKVMTDNLTIKEIPIYEVSNTSGGTTVYIAKE